MKKLNNTISTKTSIALSRACALALFSVVISNATDITNDIYELRNKNNTSSGTFSVINMRTWSTGGASFSQSYTNGTLIFGNTSQSPKKDSSIWFGGEGWQSGLVGYIKAKFEAKDVYLTGTIGSGNAWNTGGGAQLDFKASNYFKADSLNLQLKYAGLQYSNFFVEAKNISFSNSTLNVGGAIKLISDGNIALDKNSSITSSGNDIRLNAKDGSITGSPNVNFSAGTPIYVGVIEILAKDKIELGTTKLQVNASSLVGSMQGRIEVKTQSGDITFDKLELVGNNGISAFGTYAHIKAGGNLTIQTNGAIYSNRGINNSTDTAGSFSTTLEAGGNITLNNTNIFLLNQLAGIGAPDKMTIIAGGNLTHNGTISFLTNQQTWEGAKLDISGVKGTAKLGDIVGSAFYLNANKTLEAKSIHINARQTNGGFFGTGAQIWTKENGKYNFTNITLGQCGLTPWNDCEWANTARLSFFGTSGTDSNGAGGSGTNSFVKDSTLTITNLNLGSMAGLYASNIQNTNITTINMSDRSTAEFHNLTLQSGGSITMDATSQIQVKSRAYSPNTTPILGKVTLNVTSGTPFLSITNAGKNLENLNIQAGRTYRFIDAGEIKYKLGDDNEFACTNDAEKCNTIKQNFAIFSGNKDSTRLDSGANNAEHFLWLEKAGLKFEKVADYSTIGIKAVAANYQNPYDIDDIRYYIWQKGGDEAVAKIGGISKGAHTEQTTQTRINSTISTDKTAESSISEKVYLVNGKEVLESKLDGNQNAVEKQVTHLESNIFDWFNVLALHQKGVAWVANNMLAYDLNFFEKTAKQLNNTLEQLVSTERKSNAATSVRFASDLAKAQRLVKLSRIDNEEQEYRFAELLAQKRYAASGGVKSDAGGLDFGFLYKFSNRHEFHNNIWANALGSASFVEGGYGTLYGANVGYDRFIPFGENGIILGIVTSYGYGEYNAQLLKNKSHNINAGIYSRTMLKNNEIDINAGYTIGLNSEDLVTRQNIWLSSLDQSYKYNTHTINANANYGYIFSTHSSGFVFKPNIGLSYYHIFTGALSPESKEIANADNPNAPKENLAVQSPESARDLIALNLALETRQYLSKGSYWFVNVGAQKDVYISGGDIYQVRFAGEDSLNYKKSDNLNTFAIASAGGEVKIGRRMFVNFSLGGKYGISYKDIGVQANLGSRIVF